MVCGLSPDSGALVAARAVLLTSLVSGIAGLVAGFAVLALVCPPRQTPTNTPAPAAQLASDAA